MPYKVTSCVLILAAAIGAATDDQTLLDRLRSQVIENLKRAPRYTCTETINRAQYRPQPGSKNLGCRVLIARDADTQSTRIRAWRDRLRVDVAVGQNSEMFSWVGAREFGASNIQELALAGVSGTGDFSTFLTSIFGIGGADFRYAGERVSFPGPAAEFEYALPLEKSRYTYNTGDGVNRTVAYHGQLLVDPVTAELRRLIVNADDFPASSGVCQTLHTIDYQRERIGDGDFVLPEKSQFAVLYSDGMEAVNETKFSGCHEYVAESKIHFEGEDDAATEQVVEKTPGAVRRISPNTKLQVSIDPPVDATTAAAGDIITGVIAHEVRNSGEIVAWEGDKLQGRLLRLEEQNIGVPIWTVSIQFDTINHNGTRQAIRLKPLDDGERFLLPRFMLMRKRTSKLVIPARPSNGGVFLLEGIEKLILDRNFHSRWETQE